MPSYSKKVQVPGKNAQELYDAVADQVERFMSKASIGKFEISKDAGKKEVQIKSSMINATLKCADGSLALEGSISLMAMPFKSKIDEGIDHWVDKIFTRKA